MPRKCPSVALAQPWSRNTPAHEVERATDQQPRRWRALLGEGGHCFRQRARRRPTNAQPLGSGNDRRRFVHIILRRLLYGA